MAARLVSTALLAMLAAGLCGCDRPGPLSRAARGDRALPPRPLEWGRTLHDRSLRGVFPTTTRCIGFVDRYEDRYADARKVVGWSWNVTLARPVLHLAVVDAAGRMVAFGSGGGDRPDVAAAHPELGSLAFGWTLVSPTREGRYALFGLDEDSHSACYVGALQP